MLFRKSITSKYLMNVNDNHVYDGNILSFPYISTFFINLHFFQAFFFFFYISICIITKVDKFQTILNVFIKNNYCFQTRMNFIQQKVKFKTV